MNTDKVDVSWDADKKKWLVRIVVGEEVIRRYLDDSQDTDQETVRSSAQNTAADEGYTVDLSQVVFR